MRPRRRRRRRPHPHDLRPSLSFLVSDRNDDPESEGELPGGRQGPFYNDGRGAERDGPMADSRVLLRLTFALAPFSLPLRNLPAFFLSLSHLSDARPSLLTWR